MKIGFSKAGKMDTKVGIEYLDEAKLTDAVKANIAANGGKAAKFSNTGIVPFPFSIPADAGELAEAMANDDETARAVYDTYCAALVLAAHTPHRNAILAQYGKTGTAAPAAVKTAGL